MFEASLGVNIIVLKFGTDVSEKFIMKKTKSISEHF